MKLGSRELARRGVRLWFCAYILFLFCVYILYVPPTGYSSIVGPKHTLFLWGTGIFLVPLVIPGVLSRPKVPLVGTLLALGLLGTFLISSLLSEHPEVVWLGSKRHEGFVTLTLYLALFFVSSLWFSPGRLTRAAALVSAVGVFALAAAQFAGYNPFHLYPKDLLFHDRNLLYSGEYLSTIGNSDLLSAFLTMTFLFLGGQYLVYGRRLCLAGAVFPWLTLLLSEVAAGPVAIFAVLALALPLCLATATGIRRFADLALVVLAGLLAKSCLGYTYRDRVLTFAFRFGLLQAALLAGCIALPILRRFLPRTASKKAAVGVVIAYGVVILLVCGFLFFYSGSNETLRGLHLLLHGDPPDTLGSSRIRIWKEALQLGREKPLWGSGPDTYRFRSQIIFTTSTGSTVRRTSVDAAHNEYLNLWVNTGLPSMVLFIGLILSAVVPAMAHPQGDRLALLLPALGYAVHALFGISQSVVSPLFYVYLGALAHANLSIPNRKFHRKG